MNTNVKEEYTLKNTETFQLDVLREFMARLGYTYNRSSATFSSRAPANRGLAVITFNNAVWLYNHIADTAWVEGTKKAVFFNGVGNDTGFKFYVYDVVQANAARAVRSIKLRQTKGNPIQVLSHNVRFTQPAYALDVLPQLDPVVSSEE